MAAQLDLYDAARHIPGSVNAQLKTSRLYCPISRKAKLSNPRLSDSILGKPH